ncbi:UNKNOWN [Stylonychia lemnae]|uniref:Uncharacterized protein n=1 Tax=Stylonychia lemnae TaxID=5949 RepID=A0A078ABE7_STYLE|nr:UNKNOWN [Stylonychia lemnae]|eukprot:CDW79630.1 UNKNOWN [Stylonychia lemnae]
MSKKPQLQTKPTQKLATPQEEKQNQARLDENWKHLLEKEKEKLRAEKKELENDLDQFKKEISQLKKIKDKLFLEIQRLKEPVKPKKNQKIKEIQKNLSDATQQLAIFQVKNSDLILQIDQLVLEKDRLEVDNKRYLDSLAQDQTPFLTQQIDQEERCQHCNHITSIMDSPVKIDPIKLLKKEEEIQNQMKKYIDKISSMQRELSQKDKAIQEMSQEIKDQNVQGEKVIDEQLDKIIQLETQLMSVQEAKLLTSLENEKLLSDIVKLKMLIDEQLAICLKQKNKVLAMKQEQENLELDVKLLHSKLQDSELLYKSQVQEIDKLRRQLKKVDQSKKEKQKILEQQQQIEKLKTDNQVLQDMFKSLKLQIKKKEIKLKQRVSSVAEANSPMIDIDYQNQFQSPEKIVDLPSINKSYLVKSNQQSKEDLHNNMNNRSNIMQISPQLLTPLNQKDKMFGNYRSPSIKQVIQVPDSDDELSNIKQLKHKRQQSRERSGQIFRDQMDVKYQQYLDRIKDQAFGSKGIKSALSNTKNV